MAEAFSNLNALAPPSAMQTLDPRQWLVPGWYWAFLDPSEAGAVWTAFSKQNPSIQTTKTVGTTEKGSWVLFQNKGPQPVIWTLPGFPTKALKGASTEYGDIIDQSQNEPATENQLSDFLASLGKQLGTAGQVLLWGGVAIVLWQVFQHTGGTGSSRRSKKEEDYEEREEHHVTIRSPRSASSNPPRSAARSGGRTRQGTLVSYR